MSEVVSSDERQRPINHVETWVFDLDNTLYAASSGIFPQIGVRMRDFVAERLHLPLDEAFALQKQYYRTFGTTLRGLMLCHDIEPEAFLSYVHDIDHSVLEASPALDSALGRLPGEKLIFTNGSERHAVKVMERLGIAHHFRGIFDIRAADYIPKPQPESYRALLSRFAIKGSAAAMVEDLHRNLEPAAALGMTTLWVRDGNHPEGGPEGEQEPEDTSYIHHVTDDLVMWLENATVSLSGTARA